MYMRVRETETGIDSEKEKERQNVKELSIIVNESTIRTFGTHSIRQHSFTYTGNSHQGGKEEANQSNHHLFVSDGTV